ncbi:molybdenum cofactor biosynthesis protein MoaE [Gordonia terrae]|uniref:Molybdenum cofactor biosynthesis protein MoaE n=2 Tax=Gordonia terrae TaxID=2055 RepID=A0AAD0K566_9ACTN|nr:molybdenum cofactor biosynthesis protein MoaE [Gordonia terrae]VTR06850.1 Molybdopterin synthase catalytic subunit [Clostridioides difficile]ANY22546.1 molybdenum cofactor biosynthesis protein MoaE [Gordonia terrae]AWO83283.1 molybdenum cofactor biosynthesis protein MoaE [Gordonia terrae]VTS36926.1 Molybdopterin synthase catalytic subunit [Gordonia terrae]GAB43370.1 molybdenum cofactor biosynthesis protein E [Gordonia terrae NBRC 100016]
MTGDPATRVVHTGVVDEAITLAEHEAMVADAADGKAGAVVGFVGAVRDHDGGRTVTALHYSGHPTAATVLAEVVEQVSAVDGVRAVAVSHRIGDLAIGDIAFVVAVAADHRRAAFQTCSRLVDEVKARLPVWKHQFFDDGTDEWVNSA